MKLDENEPLFVIGVAAKKLNIAVPTLRMYEKAGLINQLKPPPLVVVHILVIPFQ